ncbi:hypothetical protein FB639_006038, partial [Coemansia asiatica]
MEVDSDDENGDDNIPSTQLQSNTIESAQPPRRQQNAVSIDYITRYMVLMGCLGNGKSHIMCELALRASLDKTILRVVYPLDCFKWAEKARAMDILLYLVDALHVAFVEDND